MYTIVDNKIYYIEANKLVEYEIKGGRLVKTKNALPLSEVTICEVFTLTEIKLKYKEKFEDVEEAKIVEPKKGEE